ncbi:Diaminopropionate ammonia-lyase [subsurface metagenome]
MLIQDTAWNEYIEIPALVTSGYYTQLKELEEQTNSFEKQIDLIFVQAGVGSWPSAVVHFVRNHPRLEKTDIVCIEPLQSDCFLESAKNKKLSATKKSQHTIMAGLNCGTPSVLAWEIMKSGINAFLAIDDEFAIEAMKKYYYPVEEDKSIEAGESGAAGLAGLLALINDRNLHDLQETLQIKHSTSILLFNTESITDPDFFSKHVI